MCDKTEVQLYVDSIRSSTSRLKEHLDILFKSFLEDVTKNMSPLDQAKLLGSLAFSIQALTLVYISIQSGLSADHPVHKDLTRCKSYLQKIKDLEGESLNINEKVKINTDAASRFIRNALWNADVLQAQSSNDTSPNGGHISAAHNVDDSGRINKNK